MDFFMINTVKSEGQHSEKANSCAILKGNSDVLDPLKITEALLGVHWTTG